MQNFFIAFSLVFIIISCGANGRKDITNPCNGKDYCHIFRSSGTTNGDIDTNNNGNAIPEADAICEASKPADTGTVKAFISDGVNRRACSTANCGGGTGEHIDWVLTAGREYRYSGGGTVVGTASSDKGLFTFNLLSPFYTAAGSYFSGMNANYTVANDCSNWTDSNALGTGGNGLLNVTDSTAIGDGTPDNCDQVRYLICVEQ